MKKHKVFMTKRGIGVIRFIKDNITYEIKFEKNDDLIYKIFLKYYKMLGQFKYRYYAIAKWIIRDIRKEGYNFKSNSKILNVKPIKVDSI